jgi:hypothetical protein
MSVSTIPPPPDDIVTCPACVDCRACKGRRSVTYVQREEWYERNPEVWYIARANTSPPPPLECDEDSEVSHVRLAAAARNAGAR